MCVPGTCALPSWPASQQRVSCLPSRSLAHGADRSRDALASGVAPAPPTGPGVVSSADL